METHSIVILFLAGCLAAVTTAQRKERVAPSAPRYFEVNQHRTGLRMQWEAPTAYHVDTYFIEYRSPEEEERRGITGEHWRAVTSVPGTETSYMWHGALSKHNYYLRVTAVNNDVHGDTSSVIHVEFTQKVSMPPRITKWPPKEEAYQESQENGVVLPCDASGDPAPVFRWEKDGNNLTVGGPGIQYVPGTGSIIINKPQPSDEGIYQCFATNTFGTALSTKTLLKMAVLNPFKVKDASIHRPQVGKALQLRCTPPYSYPAGSVYWGTNRPGSRLTPIATNDRIGLDYDGNFYVANVRMEDFAAAATYSCLVKNSVLRSFVIGDDNKIIPQDGNLLGQEGRCNQHSYWLVVSRVLPSSPFSKTVVT